MNNKKGWKGYEQGLICRGKQYKEGEIAEEERAEICNKGLHYCVLPNRVFEYYSPGENHEFTEVEAMDDVFTDDEVKYCTRRLKIGAMVNVFDIAKMSVLAFFDWFDFKVKSEREYRGQCRELGRSECRGLWSSECRGLWRSECRGLWRSECRGLWRSECRGLWSSECREPWSSECREPWSSHSKE